ncbi:MAG TPA: hypothetical protein VNM14_21560 [Planctomycetota bacterium]|nr:hypothetical protein [Planctomycetota bacterium]
MRPLVRRTSTIAILLLASCTAPLHSGRDNYAEGMRALRYDPGAAGRYFAEGERDLAEALQDPDLEPGDRVAAVTLRARCLIELERHVDASAQLAEEIKGYSLDKPWRGDLVGLALLKATRMDPEHAYAELLLAEKKAATLRARVHLAWEEVHVLRKIGTPQAKAEGMKICDAHAGKLDFDALKQSLSTP